MISLEIFPDSTSALAQQPTLQKVDFTGDAVRTATLTQVDRLLSFSRFEILWLLLILKKNQTQLESENKNNVLYKSQRQVPFQFPIFQLQYQEQSRNRAFYDRQSSKIFKMLTFVISVLKYF